MKFGIDLVTTIIIIVISIVVGWFVVKNSSTIIKFIKNIISSKTASKEEKDVGEATKNVSDTINKIVQDYKISEKVQQVKEQIDKTLKQVGKQSHQTAYEADNIVNNLAKQFGLEKELSNVKNVLGIKPVPKPIAEEIQMKIPNFTEGQSLKATKLYSCLKKFRIRGPHKNTIFEEINILLKSFNLPKNIQKRIAFVGVIMSTSETLTEKFNRIDINGNNVITIQEMDYLFLPSPVEKIILESCLIDFKTFFTHNTDKLIQSVLLAGDINKDKQLDFNEFRALYILKLLQFYNLLEPSFNIQKYTKNT